MDQMHPNSGGVRYDPVGYPGLNNGQNSIGETSMMSIKGSLKHLVDCTCYQVKSIKKIK